MRSEYEIFECLPDGFVVWRDHASGIINARRSLQMFLQRSCSEYFALDLAARRMLFPSEAPALGKRVLQIAYAEPFREQRAHRLRRLGYGVLSVMGNGPAKNFLTKTQPSPHDISVFLIGHAESSNARNEMVQWLKSAYPMARVLALNPPNEQLAGADYNARQNSPERWVSLVTTIADPSRSEIFDN